MAEPFVESLPELDERPLEHSPLELVVCQLRFENNLAVSDAKTASGFHEAIGGRTGDYPNIEPLAQGQTVVSASGGAPSVGMSPTMGGWRLTSKDGSWVVSLMPDHVALETSDYKNWSEDFRPRLEEVLRAAAEHVQPSTEHRLGLRYVDRIAGLPIERPSDWTEHIQEPLVGPLMHTHLGPGVRAARQHLLLGITEEINCGFAHGFLVEPEGRGPVYLLDYDLFREDGRAFDPDDILAAADEMNAYGVRLFHACVRPELLERLR